MFPSPIGSLWVNSIFPVYFNLSPSVSSLHHKELSLAAIAEANIEKGVITKHYLLSHHPMLVSLSFLISFQPPTFPEWSTENIKQYAVYAPNTVAPCVKHVHYLNVSDHQRYYFNLVLVSFYSRRMVIDKNIQVKKERENEIVKLLSEEVCDLPFFSSEFVF